MTKLTKEFWKEHIGKKLKLRNGCDAWVPCVDGVQPKAPLIVEYRSLAGSWQISARPLSGKSNYHEDWDLMPPPKTYQWYAVFYPNEGGPACFCKEHQAKEFAERIRGYYKALPPFDDSPEGG